MKSSKLIFALSFVVIGVVFYLLDSYNTFINDDVFYGFKFGTTQRIGSLSDLFESQVDHYQFRNGRFLVHCIVQFFCGIVNYHSFYFFNTCVFLVLIFAIYQYVKRYVDNISCLIPVILISTLIFIPRWCVTTIGNVSCSVNYLWCATFYFLFIFFYREEKIKQRTVNTFYSIVFFLMSLIVGSLQESFCIGISGYFIYYYLKNPKLFKGSVVPIVLGFLIGSAIIVVAPGNYIRFEQLTSHSSLINKLLSNTLSLIFGGYGVPLFLFLCLVAWLKKRDVLYSVLREHDIFLYSIIINGLFVAIFAYTGDHQLTSIGVFSMILFLILLYNLLGNVIRLHEKGFTYFIGLVLIVLSVLIFQERKKVSLAFYETWENGKCSTNKIVVSEKYDSISTSKKNWITTSFAFFFSFMEYERKWMSLYLTDGKDAEHCKIILPDKPNVIVNFCVPKYQVSQNVYKPTHKNYYILVTHGEPSSTKTIHVVSKSFPKIAIINMIKTGSPNTVQDIPLSSLLDYFTIGNNTYYIYRDFQDMKALSVELRTSES